MTLTERHIECAHLCARLEVTGQEDTKVMAQNGVLLGPRFTIGSTIGSKIRRLISIPIKGRRMEFASLDSLIESERQPFCPDRL